MIFCNCEVVRFYTWHKASNGPRNVQKNIDANEFKMLKVPLEGFHMATQKISAFELPKKKMTSLKKKDYIPKLPSFFSAESPVLGNPIHPPEITS